MHNTLHNMIHFDRQKKTMERDQRRSQVGKLIKTFKKRADVNEAELARRSGLTRSSVRRLLQGEVLPKEETIRKLKTGLRWVDDTDVIHELSDDELSTLLNAAGYIEAPLKQVEDPIEHPDRCFVYSYWNAPDLFPSRWSARIIELELSEMGNMSTMWNSLPNLTHSREYYVGAYERGLYRQDKVEAYIPTRCATRS
jgi:transcriptional regulator with XRE-family HTH domain